MCVCVANVCLSIFHCYGGCRCSREMCASMRIRVIEAMMEFDSRLFGTREEKNNSDFVSLIYWEKNKPDEVTVHRVRTYNFYFNAWTDGISKFSLNLVAIYFGTTRTLTNFGRKTSHKLHNVFHSNSFKKSASQQCTIDYLLCVSKCTTLRSSTTLIFIVVVDVFLVVVVVFLTLSHYSKFIRFFLDKKWN